MRIAIPPKLSVVLLASALLLACDARPRTSSGVSQELDTLSTYCGDGVTAVEIETCDDGNTLDNAALTAASIGYCGDGIRNGFELCDDGNLDDTDHCSSSCRLIGSQTPSWYVRNAPISGHPYCGDGLVNQSSEACDDGNGDDTDHCTNRCLIQEPVDQPNSIVSTNNNQNQQEDDPCFAIQTALGLPTEWCD